MSLANRLSLDHFYISLSASDVLKIEKHLQNFNAKHEIVRSGDDSWSGHYIHSRIGEYFEILEETRKGGFGLAYSATHPAYFDTKKIIDDLPWDWKSGERKNQNGEPWFDWYSTGNYLDQSEIFNVWVMDYHRSHRSIKDLPVAKKVLTFDEINLSIGLEHQDYILNILKLPFFHSVQIQKNRIEFKVLKKDGWYFNVVINLLPGNDRFKPLSLKLSTVEDDKLLRHFIEFE